MTVSPLLSICIPTYNREIFLRECLASLNFNEVRDQVEIVVSDNASTDKTIQVLEEFQSSLPIRWIVQKSNLGSDLNFDAIVTEARGEYCWLLGSDDAVMRNTIPRLIELLRIHDSDILQFGYVQSDISLRALRQEYPKPGFVESTVPGLARHFSELSNLSLFFTFISAFVFRRTVWLSHSYRLMNWVGSHYIQTAVMHSALFNGARLIAVDECLVMARGNNPTEFNTIPGRFIELDAQTMMRLMTEIYDNSKFMWKAIGQIFRRSYPPKAIIYSAANGGINFINEVKPVLIKLGYRHTLLIGLKIAEKLNLLGIIKLVLNLRRSVINKFISKASI